VSPASAQNFIGLTAAFLAIIAALATPWQTFAQANQNRTPSPRQALQLRPVQRDVEYDIPSPEEIDRCTMEPVRVGKQAGWSVRGADGTILRRFMDTNADNLVDQWSYFKEGLEVYRDIDGNFNGKADQYRWFHTAGTRWGLDPDEDGRINSWRIISAEEVTAEVVTALARREWDRFARVSLTTTELKSLGLGPTKTKELEEKLASLAEKFKKFTSQPQGLDPNAKWLQFSGFRPGIIPAGTDGSTQEIRVYENVVALAESGGQNIQLLIGTLVSVGDTWRVIDLPQLLDGDQPAIEISGFFFRAQSGERPASTTPLPEPKIHQLVEELEKREKAIEQATPAQLATVYQQKADLLEQIIQASSAEDRAIWIKQLADMLSFTAQEGSYPQALERLKQLFGRVQKEAGRDLVAYVRYRLLTAEYGLAIRQPNVDFAKLQTDWTKQLEAFVTEYAQSPETAEAMLQLAIAQELTGEEASAKKWYSRIVEQFPGSHAAIKAAGAQRRLESVGKPLVLRGPSPTGETIDLTQLRGKIVLVHYWASWCEPCKAEIAALKDLQSRFNRYGFSIVGINLDHSPEAMQNFIREYQLTWPQLYEPGGLDSRLANELGIVTVPTMILLDQQGRVVNRSLQVAELEAELKRLIR